MQISACPLGGSGGVIVMIEGAKPRSINTERKSFLISVRTGVQLAQNNTQAREKAGVQVVAPNFLCC